MTLQGDLERIASAAGAFGTVAAVLAAEPAGGRRTYLVAIGDAGRGWLVLDDDGSPVDERGEVRATASVVALCVRAADVAGGGDPAGLRAHVHGLVERGEATGLDVALAAIAELERVVGEPPRLASPAYLDEVGAATLALEHALGDLSSPFAEALRTGTAAVDEFVRDVEGGYVLALR